MCLVNLCCCPLLLLPQFPLPLQLLNSCILLCHMLQLFNKWHVFFLTCRRLVAHFGLAHLHAQNLPSAMLLHHFLPLQIRRYGDPILLLIFVLEHKALQRCTVLREQHLRDCLPEIMVCCWNDISSISRTCLAHRKSANVALAKDVQFYVN